MLVIEEIPVDNLKPYEKNSRAHSENSIVAIKKSISKYGMNDPIGIWGENNIVVEGHGRLEACKELGIETVPCVRLDHLTDKERKEYTIAHNATTEFSDWNVDILVEELKTLNLSADDFNFDFNLDIGIKNKKNKDKPNKEKENERERTYNTYNLHHNDLERTIGKYQMPIIKRQYVKVPDQDPIGFNYVLTTESRNRAVHFFLDDYQFERIWNDPIKYAEILSEFDCVFSPDFSLYSDMPIAMQIWNIYRSRLIGQIMQDYGVKVVPTISWSEKESFDFCFDGIETGSICVISTIGVKKNNKAYSIWREGVNEMISRIKPSQIWIYGGSVEYDFGGIPTLLLNNQVTERWKNNENRQV